MAEMKRTSNARTENPENEGDDGSVEIERRSRRRQRIRSDDSESDTLQRTEAVGPDHPSALFVNTPSSVTATRQEPYASLHNNSPEKVLAAGQHSIEALGIDVNLPDYVKVHNSTLTFPEKVRVSRFVFRILFLP
jgi:hypothetical protein